MITITASFLHLFSAPAIYLNRGVSNPEDPTISLYQFATHTIYSEASSTVNTNLVSGGMGANVFIYWPEVCPPVCPNACMNGGKCIAYSNCSCVGGWYGPGCGFANCTDPCVNGVCTTPDKCTCNLGWTGRLCDRRMFLISSFISVLFCLCFLLCFFIF